jgi:hypothetical protein
MNANDMLLTNAAVSAIQLEESAFKLLEEWLKFYFDGGEHPIGGHTVEHILGTEASEPLADEEDEELGEEIATIKFPTAHLRFQQSSLPALGDNIGITVVWVTSSAPRRDWETVDGRTQQVMTQTATWFFFIRAEGKADATGANAQARCRTGADLLYALLLNSKTALPLAQKGILKVRPENPTVVSEGKGNDKPDLNYIVRMLKCSARLRFPVLSQPTT